MHPSSTAATRWTLDHPARRERLLWSPSERFCAVVESSPDPAVFTLRCIDGETGTECYREALPSEFELAWSSDDRFWLVTSQQNETLLRSFSTPDFHASKPITLPLAWYRSDGAIFDPHGRYCALGAEHRLYLLALDTSSVAWRAEFPMYVAPSDTEETPAEELEVTSPNALSSVGDESEEATAADHVAPFISDLCSFSPDGQAFLLRNNSGTVVAVMGIDGNVQCIVRVPGRPCGAKEQMQWEHPWMGWGNNHLVAVVGLLNDASVSASWVDVKRGTCTKTYELGEASHGAWMAPNATNDSVLLGLQSDEQQLLVTLQASAPGQLPFRETISNNFVQYAQWIAPGYALALRGGGKNAPTHFERFNPSKVQWEQGISHPQQLERISASPQGRFVVLHNSTHTLTCCTTEALFQKA